MEGTVLQGVFIDQAIEVPFEFTGHCGRPTGARAVDEALDTLVREAIDPLAQGRIRKGERIRDGLEALPFDDLADRLGTAEDAGLFGLFDEGI
jgi:hypothetical protein